MADTTLTVQQVSEDLCFANEIAEDFNYFTHENGTTTAEQYDAVGSVCATYAITITITETTAANTAESSN